MSGLATFVCILILVAMMAASLSAHRTADREYEKLRSLGAILPNREAMGSWLFTQQFLPKEKSRRYHAAMIGSFALLFLVVGLDAWLRA